MTNALTLLAEFDKYFQSMNRVPPEVRTSVPTAEWIELRDAVRAALAPQAPVGVGTDKPRDTLTTAGSPSILRDAIGAKMPCGTMVSNVYEAYEAGKLATPAPQPLPSGWRVVRNTDGSIGIFAPTPAPGESPRTSAAVYVSDSRDLHELLAKLADHMTQAPSAAPAQQPEQWRDAVLDALAAAGGDMPATATPAEIVRAVIDAHVQIALDPRVSDFAQEPQPEPLFLLHTGQIDSDGEQDEWDTEADSQVRVDAFCAQHPGKTIGLYPKIEYHSVGAEVARLRSLVSEAPHYFHPGYDFDGKKLEWLKLAGLVTPEGKQP